VQGHALRSGQTRVDARAGHLAELRYLWTDAFGVVLLVSLYAESGERRYLDDAEWVVSEVDRVLGRRRGIRIGEAPDRDGQYWAGRLTAFFESYRSGDNYDRKPLCTWPAARIFLAICFDELRHFRRTVP
jgi:hypothetical protein